MRRVLGLFAYTLILIGCGSSATGEAKIHWYDDREYQLYVYNLGNEPLLKIDVNYNGKSPRSGKDIQHSWQNVDTDFYDVRIENISRYLIVIDHIEYVMGKGTLYSKHTKSAIDIKKDYGQSHLSPGDVMRNDNAYVWAKDDNILHRIFVLDVEGKTIRADIPLIYQR